MPAGRIAAQCAMEWCSVFRERSTENGDINWINRQRISSTPARTRPRGTRHRANIHTRTPSREEDKSPISKGQTFSCIDGSHFGTNPSVPELPLSPRFRFLTFSTSLTLSRPSGECPSNSEFHRGERVSLVPPGVCKRSGIRENFLTVPAVEGGRGPSEGEAARGTKKG